MMTFPSFEEVTVVWYLVILVSEIKDIISKVKVAISWLQVMLYFAGKNVENKCFEVKMTDLQSCNAESLVRLPETRFNGRQFGLTVSSLWGTL